jgi:hypothetical protein
MKKMFVCFMSALIVSAGLFAQQPLIIKAPPMAMMNPLTPDEASSVGGVYDKMLAEAKTVRILNRLVIEKGMRDYGFQPKDWPNAEKKIALGEVLNVDWVVRPQVQRRVSVNDGGIIVTAVLLNVQTQEITCATPVLLGNVNEAQKMEPLINEITRIITGGTGGISQSDKSSVAYKTGDRGPAGGWVFHDKGSYADGWRYLEIAPWSAETTMPRNIGVEKIPGTDTVIGSGKRNTELILQSKEEYQQKYQIMKAAKMCANSEVNWFTDWFLPSYAEIKWFDVHLIGGNFANLNTGYYWSSSGGSDASVRLSWADGKSPDRNQAEYFVRAMRAF